MAGAGWQKKNMKIKKRPFANSVGVKNQSLISLSKQTAKMCCAVKHLNLRYNKLYVNCCYLTLFFSPDAHDDLKKSD